jgi:hypothetical protein
VDHRDDHLKSPAAHEPGRKGGWNILAADNVAPALGAADAAWQPDPAELDKVDALIRDYRRDVVSCLEPLVKAHYPALLAARRGEYRKMVELSTKMTLVGHACCEIAGFDYDEHRRTIGSLFGGCCFLADSFIDDFGPAATREYIERLELLLTTGWFDVSTDRERLFYAIVSRLFMSRDVLDPMLRQAILLLFEAQKRDTELRLSGEIGLLSRRDQLTLLRHCARDRSGHAITVLTGFVAPEIDLAILPYLFTAGALIMHIDDHGDCYADLRDGRVTYLNQVRRPAATLRRIFLAHVTRLHAGLPANAGRDLMIAFLTRYFLTRLEKHRLQRLRSESAWAVYE